MSCFIEEIEAAQMKQDLPKFSPGDTVVVQVKVTEGSRQRLQAFEGVVIAKRNRGLHSAFTVRKMSHGEGVERVFQTHSPVVDSIKVKRRGDVRQAKLYYLRGLTGKAARIKEKLETRKEKELKAMKAEKVVKAPKAEEKVETPVTKSETVQKADSANKDTTDE